MLNERGQKVKYGTVRELLSQMVKDGQVKNLCVAWRLRAPRLPEEP